MESNKNIVWTIVILIIVLVGGYFLLASGPEEADSEEGRTPPKSAVINLPPLTQDELLGKAEIPDAALDAVAKHKADILKRIASGKPLTQEEKGAIGNVMLTEAHIYKFTDQERDSIFAALQQ